MIRFLQAFPLRDGGEPGHRRGLRPVSVHRRGRPVRALARSLRSARHQCFQHPSTAHLGASLRHRSPGPRRAQSGDRGDPAGSGNRARRRILSFAVGSALGCSAGFWGGWTDRIVGRLSDTIMAFPLFVLAMGVVAALGNSVENIIYATAIINLPFYARVARAETSVRRTPGTCRRRGSAAAPTPASWRPSFSPTSCRR